MSVAFPSICLSSAHFYYKYTIHSSKQFDLIPIAAQNWWLHSFQAARKMDHRQFMRTVQIFVSFQALQFLSCQQKDLQNEGLVYSSIFSNKAVAGSPLVLKFVVEIGGHI